MQCHHSLAQPVPFAATNRSVSYVLTLVLLLMLLTGCSTAPSGAPAAAESAVGEAAAAPEAPAPEPATVAAEATTPATTDETAATATTFRIAPEGTEARFLINEVLMGQPKTVVGVTSQVEGTITVDSADLATAQISAIRINARDLSTDDDRRNNQLRRRILQSDQDPYQYITFQPTTIEGLPETGAAGESYTFRVAGDLTILETTQPVTFELTVTAASPTELTGTAAATIRYPDFGISIPSVPMVAGVEEEVKLELDFKASAKS